ncbi:unnamed protein product [Paramecium sonneborni]|uniref:WD40-repeat-containing domain n=1 Tax=Paramecium sonneborni TaxID=65129 RepID=A0A8S1QUK8_9CILI|nr:unnamed protein product [Paramecium sonneborni]
MSNPLLVQSCQEHQEPIVAVAFNDQNKMNQVLCLKCWPSNYNKKVVLVGDVLDISKNIKEEYQQFDSDIKLNVQKLYQLMQELEKLKIFIKQSINKQITAINDWIQSISDQEQQTKSSLSILNLDLNKQLQNAQQLTEESQKQKERCIQFISEQLLLLKENEHFNKCIELFTLIKEDKFDPPQNSSVQFQSQIDKSQIQQNNLICQQHENEIVMVDLHQKPKIPNRLACVYCIQNYPTQYTAIKVAQKLWQKQETLKILNLHKYSESIDQINQSFNTIKTNYNDVIKDITSSLCQNNQDIKQKAQNYLNNLNIDWLALKNDDVTELAGQISQPDYHDIEKSKIYQDFISINQEINHKINEAFTKMKLSQSSGKKQIKQLINQEYFGQIQTQKKQLTKNTQKKAKSYKKYQNQTIQIKDISNHIQQQQEQNPQINNQNLEIKINKQKTIELNNTQQSTNEKMNINIQKQSELIQQVGETLKHKYNQDQTNNEKKLHFKLNSNPIDQKEACRSFSFNSDSTLLIASCQKQIKLFQFIQGNLILSRILDGHPSLIVYCIFLKNQNRFVSGCEDGSMLIWSNTEEENEKEWECEQILNGHKDYLGQIIYSKIDNMIISCSNDHTIKFWKKSQNWELHQTLIGHNQYVCSISLNESENKLISGAYDDQILVSEPKGDDKKWIIIQVIKVEWGRRLCFITDNIFTFQPCKKNFMHIYQEKDSKKGFYKSKEISVQFKGQNCLWLFPQQFSKKQGLLLNKNCHTLNIIRWKGKNKFVTDQTINFETNEIYGSMSDDGLWLITWDNQSKQIQIRSLQ